MKDIPEQGIGIRGKFVFDKKAHKWIPAEGKQAPRLHYVQQDTFDEPFEYMGNANREMVESRSQYKRMLERDGFEVVGEDFGVKSIVGTAPYKSEEQKRKERRDAIEKRFYDLKYDRVPVSEKEKEICKREMRELEAEAKRQGVKLNLAGW